MDGPKGGDTYFSHSMTLLHYSAEQGKLEIFKSVSATLANIQLKTSGEAKGATPLHWAGTEGRMNIVRYITNCLTNINPADDDGLTVMHYAARRGQLEVINFYIDRLNEKNPPQISNDEFNGRTPLHYAPQWWELEVVRAITAVISDKNTKDSHDVTPFHLAALQGHLHVIEYMCDNYVNNVDIKTDSFWNHRTPLHYACIGGHLDVIRYLIQKGADPKIRSSNGKTAYDLTIEENHTDVSFYWLLIGNNL